MGVTVSRHTIPAAHAEAGVAALRRRAEERIDGLEGDPRGFNRAMSLAVTSAEAHCLVDARAARLETWEAWVAAMQVGSALFAAATAEPDAVVECRIAHKVRAIQATGAQYFTDAGTWITAYWMAVIGRDTERMTALCHVPITVLRDSGAVFDEYIYDWVDTLQTGWLQRPSMDDKLVAAINETGPERLRVADRELMLKILYPPLNLFYRYLRQDYDAFNTELAKALEWHKEYWTADEERMSDSSGAVALGPLAITCLAYDAGFPIEVESEYLPKHLVQRTWIGEFDT